MGKHTSRYTQERNNCPCEFEVYHVYSLTFAVEYNLQEKSDRVADGNSLRSLVTGIQKETTTICLVLEAQWVGYECHISYIYICLRDLLVLFDAHELTKQITNIDYIYSIYVIYYICLIVSLWRKICILFMFLSIYLF